MNDLIDSMKIYFATNFVYYTKSHGYHVNVVGPDFYQYHKLLQKIYEDSQENIDSIAEEIRTLQSVVPFSLQRITQLSIIEDASDTPDALTMISEILEDTLQLVDVIKIAHKNATEQECYGLLNYLEQRLDDHWKFIWMLRATLEPQK